ncbi:nucleotidyltransferase domain-containing protein [Cohnella rhizosphaerae]|uniref:Nucleotidyltransferase family protein n=1 Tax=Cohnella rhizosphaerae TaxID=1457232 RepID=A0A9X4QTU6_9BACL|nr:hypothetical protein [Cohnella rhizosphaerae]MDG0810794.1 hypothetical protein [Cohnella rhizosphaerae]
MADAANVWAPLGVAEIHRLFGEWDGAWGIAGGWALDLRLGRQTRPHDDIDVLLPLADYASVYARLGADWELHLAEKGRLTRLGAGGSADGGDRHLGQARFGFAVGVPAYAGRSLGRLVDISENKVDSQARGGAVRPNGRRDSLPKTRDSAAVQGRERPDPGKRRNGHKRGTAEPGCDGARLAAGCAARAIPAGA